MDRDQRNHRRQYNNRRRRADRTKYLCKLQYSIALRRAWEPLSNQAKCACNRRLRQPNRSVL